MYKNEEHSYNTGFWYFQKTMENINRNVKNVKYKKAKNKKN